MQHQPEHRLGDLHPGRSKGWRYCLDCHFIVCGECRRWDCTCDMTEQEIHDREQVRLMRAGRSQGASRTEHLATSQEKEVGSQTAPQGATRPQEGQPEMAAKTKDTAEKAPKAAAEKKPDRRRDPEARRGKGQLESLVAQVTERYENGDIELGEGETLTPHRIATFIGHMDGQDKPSGGAVAAILKRWDTYGYALTHDKPFAFKKVSANGKKQGLDKLKEKHRETAKADRAAAREAAKESAA